MENKKNLFGFRPGNYRILLIGLAINIIGFILMLGGGTDNPANFDETKLFSNIRITISPMLIISGYLVIMYSIMRKPKSTVSNKEEEK
ncbi:MAG: DUF3098 domain-containing protein [Flavobacteriia bacterium]|nr:DUF3098 domain-containing protein [Flavobacteriia bacterium]